MTFFLIVPFNFNFTLKDIKNSKISIFGAIRFGFDMVKFILFWLNGIPPSSPLGPHYAQGIALRGRDLDNCSNKQQSQGGIDILYKIFLLLLMLE